MRSFVPSLLAFFSLLVVSAGECMAQVCGCTDSLAINYNASATVNDGSCLYEDAVVHPVEVGAIDPRLDNTSSLIYWENGYWTFNDKTSCCLYLLDSTNAVILDSLCIEGIENKDIEEIAQDSLYLYLGDVGNNIGWRQDLHILRISKESLLNQTFEVDTIWFSYEDQTDFSYQLENTDFDCEAFVVTHDSIYLFTKQWNSEQTTFYGIPKTPGTYIAHRHETYDVQGLVTGATYVPEYRLVVLCGYDFNGGNYLTALHPFIVLLYDFQGDNFFSGNKRRLDFGLLVKQQTEAIATSNALDFYLTNEHFTTTSMGITIDRPAKLQRLDLREYLLPYLSRFGFMDNPAAVPGLPADRADFWIYPNPATDRIYIDCPRAYLGANYEIRSLNGQRVAAGVLKDRFISLNDRNMPAGQYVLTIRKDRSLKTTLFVKQE